MPARPELPCKSYYDGTKPFGNQFRVYDLLCFFAKCCTLMTGPFSQIKQTLCRKATDPNRYVRSRRKNPAAQTHGSPVHHPCHFSCAFVRSLDPAGAQERRVSVPRGAEPHS